MTRRPVERIVRTSGTRGRTPAALEANVYRPTPGSHHRDVGDCGHGNGRTLERVGSGLRRFVAVPLERQTYLNLAYLLLAFPLGLAYVVFVTVGVSVGLGLSILLVGIPILVATLAFTLAVAGFERWLTVTMLDLEIEPRSREANERTRDRLVSLCTNPKNWSALLYVPAKFVLGTVSFSVALTGFSTGASMLMLPLYYDRPGLYVGVVSDRAQRSARRCISAGTTCSSASRRCLRSATGRFRRCRRHPPRRSESSSYWARSTCSTRSPASGVVRPSHSRGCVRPARRTHTTWHLILLDRTT